MAVSLPSASYPGIDVIASVRRSLRHRRGKTSREIAEEIKREIWRVRSSLAGLLSLGLAVRRRNGRKLLYYTVRTSLSLEDAFVSHAECHSILWSILIGSSRISEIARRVYSRRGSRSTREKRVYYAVRLGRDLGFVEKNPSRLILSARGAMLTLAVALERAYADAVEEPSEPVPLTEIRRTLEVQGLPRKLFDALALGALSKIPRARLSPAPAISRAVIEDSLRDERGRHLYFLTIQKFTWR